LVALAFLVLSGCDTPTEEPSVTTETDINTPLIAKKTLSFLGGPSSEFEPLVDTTSSTFDSLFTVTEEPKDISIVQEVDNFDVGSLEGALDEAGGDLSIDDEFSEPLIKDSELSNQTIDASYRRENRPYQTGDPAPGSGPIADDDNDDEVVIDFPAPGLSTGQVLEAPDFGAVDASGATVDSVELTDETGEMINEIEFTLSNDGNNTLAGTEGTGTPQIQIQDTEGGGTTLRTADFGETIAPGGEATATLDVSTLVLDASTQYRLLVSGTDAANPATLEIDISPWRYQAAYLSDAGNVDVRASQDRVSAAGGGASRFEGIEVGGGTNTLLVNNQLSFDLAPIDIQVQNNEADFGSVPALDVDETLPSAGSDRSEIGSGEDASTTIDMAGKGITRTVDVSGVTKPSGSNVKVSADGFVEVSNTGALDIRTMYFRPDGEEAQTSGTVEVGGDQDRVDFERGDYVELSSFVIDVNQLALQTKTTDDPDPQVTFDTLSLSYPGFRVPPYNPEDSLEIRFFENGDEQGGAFTRAQIGTGPRSFEVAVKNQHVRVYPRGDNNEVRFTVQGRLESNPNAQAVLNANDQITANVQVQDEEFRIQELKASRAEPFTVEVTADQDAQGEPGYQELNLSNDGEVRTASFGGFEGLTGRLDGLQLANVNLNFAVETQNLASTDAQVYAAMQGVNSSQRLLLAGTEDQNQSRSQNLDVSSLPFDTEFVKEGGRSIARDSLIRFGIGLDDARLGERVERPLVIDGDNSNVGTFVNALPTSIRFAGQAEVNTDGGDLRLARPVRLDAGFTVDVPLQIKDQFVVYDTLDADFSSFEDLTDPDENLNVSTAELSFGYENTLPLGADVQMTVVDENGRSVKTFTPDDGLRIQPAPKAPDGAAAGAARGTSKGTATLPLGESRDALRALADGRSIQLQLTLSQKEGPPARLRADDTIRLDLRLNVEATVGTSN
jgi:hypothetical protein